AVTTGYQLVCFGDNKFGQCDVPPSLGMVTAVSAGTGHTCAVTMHGSLVCFGRNSRGECDVPADLGIVWSVSAGDDHTCAIQSSGRIVCFGGRGKFRDFGQCDVPPDLGPAVSVSAGNGHTCAVKPNGQLVCWGWNCRGQCLVPEDLGPILAVSAGNAVTCAVTITHQLVCFGSNIWNECEVPETLGPVTAAASGLSHTCAVQTDGEVPYQEHDCATQVAIGVMFAEKADIAPLLVVSTASLQALAEGAGKDIPADRFRPNVILEGPIEPHAEDTWDEMRIGPLRLKRLGPCARCAIVDVAQGQGKRDNAVYGALVQHRGQAVFGQYYRPMLREGALPSERALEV
ncbi:MTARC1, partial [Symbiodinium pilosum]